MSVPSIAYVYVGADGTVAAHAIDVRSFCESVAGQAQSSFALAWALFDKRCLFARYATTSQDLLEIVIQQASQIPDLYRDAVRREAQKIADWAEFDSRR